VKEMEKNNYFVYLHTFPNGKHYIGLTMQEPRKRFMNGRGYKKCPKMWSAIQKYGWENVRHDILYSGLTKEEAEATEIRLIKEYDSIDNGYNIQHGGNTTGTHNMETRRKISLENKGKKKPPLTEEHKRRISEANKANPFRYYPTEEERKKHSLFMMGNQYNKGHHHSEEFKRMKSKQMHEKYSGGNHPRRKAVVVESDRCLIEYATLREAAMCEGVCPATAHKYLNSNKVRDGKIWRYA
jgi:group I intron endonuclease